MKPIHRLPRQYFYVNFWGAGSLYLTPNEKKKLFKKFCNKNSTIEIFKKAWKDNKYGILINLMSPI